MKHLKYTTWKDSSKRNTEKKVTHAYIPPPHRLRTEESSAILHIEKVVVGNKILLS